MTYSMMVPEWIWEAGKKHWNVDNPAPRLRDVLTEAWSKGVGRNGHVPPAENNAVESKPVTTTMPKQSNFAEREDKGRILLATQNSICCVCGVLIETGEEFCWFTDKEAYFGVAGQKKAECIEHHRK